MSIEALTEAANRLWRVHFGDGTAPELTPCAAGGNNRVFIARADRRTAILKWYFRDATGTRDRLDAEWRFLDFAAAHGIVGLPRPFARDPVARLALIEYCPGARPVAIGSAEIDAAARLFRALNHHRALPEAALLPPAAEACFSLSAQITLVDRRLARLEAIAAAAGAEPELPALLERMRAGWSRLRHRLPCAAGALGIDPQAEIPPSARCLSPSDFGFHNALAGPDGVLRFVDFEYAGWDDPAKFACDFFLQPAVPVPRGLRERFLEHALGEWPDASLLRRRIELMAPLFALKWCCIMLNPFVPALAGAGRFAAPDRQEAALRSERIAAASAALSDLQGL